MTMPLRRFLLNDKVALPAIGLKPVLAAVLSLALLLPAVNLFAQKKKKPTKAELETTALIDRLRQDVTYLASDSLQGRRTGTDGERMAGDYLIARYQSLGIPAYRGGNYRIPFPFNYGKEIGHSTRIRIGNEDLRIPEEAFPMPFSASKRVITDVLPDVLEQGNLWLRPLYTSKADAENPHYDWEKAAYEQTKEAIKQGATAVVFYDSYGASVAPQFNARSEWSEPLSIPVVVVALNPWQHARTSNYQGAVHIELHVQLRAAERTGNNIAAFIDNKAPLTVVLGAHYDHLGHGEDGNSLYAGKDEQIHNGADDNASGTAALLALAEKVKKDKLKKYNYLFLHFSGEELGLFGSKALVKEAGLDSSRVAWMLNMDMVGRLNDSTKALTVGGLGTSPAWAYAKGEADKQYKVIVDSSGIGPSDHTSFYNAGVPVLFLFSGTHSDYHKPTDDADRINYPGEAGIIGYAYNLIRYMDGQPRPAFTRTSQSTVGRVKFKVTLGLIPDYSYTTGDGLRIDGVSDGKPAAAAGLQTGDIITKLGNVEVKGIQSYMEALGELKAGTQTTISYKRGDKELTAPVALP